MNMSQCIVNVSVLENNYFCSLPGESSIWRRMSAGLKMVVFLLSLLLLVLTVTSSSGRCMFWALAGRSASTLPAEDMIQWESSQVLVYCTLNENNSLVSRVGNF